MEDILKCNRYVCKKCGKSMLIETTGIRHWGCMGCGTTNYEENYLELRIGKELEQEAERRGYEKCKDEMEINTLGKLLDAKDTLYKDNITYLASYTSGYYRAIEDLIKLYKLSNKEVGERLKNYCKLILWIVTGKQDM